MILLCACLRVRCSFYIVLLCAIFINSVLDHVPVICVTVFYPVLFIVDVCLRACECTHVF
jgi:hypothetical protein